jgi:stalled ribosome rescue protein Dom34
VAAVVMQEGLAHVCLVLSSMTLVRAKIDQSIPRKRHGNVSNHEKVRRIEISRSIMCGLLFLVDSVSEFSFIQFRVFRSSSRT